VFRPGISIALVGVVSFSGFVQRRQTAGSADGLAAAVPAGLVVRLLLHVPSSAPEHQVSSLIDEINIDTLRINCVEEAIGFVI
jgi:hypothetical protein